MWKAFGTFLKSLFPSIGTGLGALLSGKVFGLTRAEKQQNAFNAQQAAENRDFQLSAMRENNAFAADQAQAQMDFQEKMANTQWQRGVKDMQAAGLNPALAYGQGGASAMSGAAAAASGTPSGSAASGSGRGAIGSLSDIMQLAMMKKQLRAMDDEHNERVEGIRGQQLQNDITAEFGKIRASAEYSKILAEVDKYLEDANTSRYQRQILGPLEAALKSAQAKSLSAEALINEWRSNYIARYDSDPSAPPINQALTSLLEWLNADERFWNRLGKSGN